MTRSRVVRWGSNRGLGQTTQVRDTIRGSERGNVTQDCGLNNLKEYRKREGHGRGVKGRMGLEGVV